jgi:hypothetical protein
VKALLLLFLTACLLFSNDNSFAEDRIFVQDESMVLIGESRLEPEALYIRQIYHEAKGDIENVLDWRLLSRPTVFLIGNKESFEKISGSPFVSALAIPSQHTVIIHITSSTSKPYILNETFRHEMCHLILHDHIKESDLPRWLDEGICQWVTGTFGEIIGSGEWAPISRIEMARRLIPLNLLTTTFPRDKESLFLAYQESRSFVEFVAAHYGTVGLLRILKNLAGGAPTDVAVSNALGRSFREVQADWFDDMQRRGEWFIWGAQHLYEIIFFGAAVLSVLAFVRLRGRIRRARFSDEEGDDDQP